MTVDVKLRKIGNSVGFILPKRILSRLKVKAGDKLYLSGVADEYPQITTSPSSARKTQVFENLSQRYRNALRDLSE